MEHSKLVMHAVGYVAKDIKEDEWFVDVYPIETNPTGDGDINKSNMLETTTVNINGGVISAMVDKSVLITAKWKSIGQSNRITPPNVCMGETVLLYNYAGTDEYYWDTYGTSPDLRKREKSINYYSNKGSTGKANFEDKAYIVTIDTINKIVKLTTDDSDGEHTSYNIELDTANGTLVIADGKDNSIILDSADNSLTVDLNNKFVLNTAKEVIINTKDLKIKSSNKMDVKLKYFSVSNGRDELMALLVETLQAIMDEMHIGNLGIPTAMSPVSKIIFKKIQERAKAFIS